jgi:hypothetical protein
MWNTCYRKHTALIGGKKTEETTRTPEVFKGKGMVIR